MSDKEIKQRVTTEFNRIAGVEVVDIYNIPTAVAHVMELITEARKDEVKNLLGLNERYDMSFSSKHKIYNYINDRTAELNKGNK